MTTSKITEFVPEITKLKDIIITKDLWRTFSIGSGKVKSEALYTVKCVDGISDQAVRELIIHRLDDLRRLGEAILSFCDMEEKVGNPCPADTAG